MARSPRHPDLTLNEQELMGTYSEVFPILMDMLSSFHPETPVTGDDLYAFFGLCFASLIDNDTNLTTPRDLRLGGETAAVHALGWVKKLKDMRGAEGPSFLSYVLDEARKVPHVHGPDCAHQH